MGYKKHTIISYLCNDSSVRTQMEMYRLAYSSWDDVEIAAIKSISSLYEKDYMQFLKVYFYNKPAVAWAVAVDCLAKTHFFF